MHTQANRIKFLPYDSEMGKFPKKAQSVVISLQLSERLCLVCFCLSEAQKHMSNMNLSQCSRYKFAVNFIWAMSALRISFTRTIIRCDVFFFLVRLSILPPENLSMANKSYSPINETSTNKHSKFVVHLYYIHSHSCSCLCIVHRLFAIQEINTDNLSAMGLVFGAFSWVWKISAFIILHKTTL